MEIENVLKFQKHVEDLQRMICGKYNAEFSAVTFDKIIGVAIGTFKDGNMPINGLRHSTESAHAENWFIWVGEEWSTREDFFKPTHVEHLVDICPEALIYLGLAPGWRFLFDRNGHEDVWYDKTLLDI